MRQSPTTVARPQSTRKTSVAPKSSRKATAPKQARRPAEAPQAFADADSNALYSIAADLRIVAKRQAVMARAAMNGEIASSDLLASAWLDECVVAELTASIERIAESEVRS
jgi:hypothetical protein